jgi:hypothetical protein
MRPDEPIPIFKRLGRPLSNPAAAQGPAPRPIAWVSLLGAVVLAVFTAWRLAPKAAPEVLTPHDAQAPPQSSDMDGEQEPVPASIRVISLVALAIFVAFGWTTKHRVPELGLAFVTGGALLATPQLVAALVASQDRERASVFTTRLRTIAFLGVIGLGILVFKDRPHGLAVWKLGLLFAAALLELLTVLIVVPYWVAGSARILFPPGESNRLTRMTEKLAPCLRTVAEAPAKGIAAIEEDDGFLILGAALFLAGTIMQFIAGA